MSYTNIDLVKKHISLDDVGGGLRRDYPVIFVEQEWIGLPGRGLVESSLRVKAIRDYSPVFEEIVLTDGIVSLTNNYLVPDSMTVASDSSLGAIYKENTDYSVDCDNGTVKRLDGSDIESGSTVSVWYYYYSLYEEDTDYGVDYREGMVRRLPGSTIEANQTVLIDYRLSGSQLNDPILSEAVLEANAIVERQVDPHRQFGADPILQTAATFLAVSLVCRMMAACDLKYNLLGRQTAAAWLSLAESYRDDYTGLLKDFRPKAARLSGPAHS
ncbi:MAG: hypothetical protein JSU69_09885 [Candidatus Zixiibacteriota bacterium]|nr:MAG: hypothetical protein JSU69_09885 [candidate division Zixibacteria bacterium]